MFYSYQNSALVFNHQKRLKIVKYHSSATVNISCKVIQQKIWHVYCQLKMVYDRPVCSAVLLSVLVLSTVVKPLLRFECIYLQQGAIELHNTFTSHFRNGGLDMIQQQNLVAFISVTLKHNVSSFATRRQTRKDPQLSRCSCNTL